MTSTRYRIAAALILTVGGLWMHELIQAVPTPLAVVDNPIDNAIPFLPWTIWIYFSFFVFIATTTFRVEETLFWRFVIAATLAACIAWTIVVLFPITSVRPDPQTIESDLYRYVFTFVHNADPHHITFPSLHVAVTWICNFTLWHRNRRGWRVALGIGITLSTLFTKQHLLIDVAGGVLLAGFCTWITGRYIDRLPFTSPRSPRS